MKKYTLFFILFTTISIYSKAQNLQFSKVIYHTFQSSATYNSGSTLADTFTLVVPANKAVKIESASANAANGLVPTDFDNAQGLAISLNGIVLTLRTQLFPIWLPEGIYKFALIPPSGISGSYLKGYISGIEYTIYK